MYIQSMPHNNMQKSLQVPSFNGNISKLFEPMKDTKICKKMTEFDRRCLLGYLNIKPYMLGITTKEVDELSKFEGEEFIIRTANFIMDKFKIPKQVRPAISFQKIEGDGIMAYSPSMNFFMVDPNKNKALPKNALFGLVRHELTHLQQNMSILRHETIGEKAIEEYTKVTIPIYKKILIESFERDANMNVDKAIELNIIRPEDRYILENAKKIYDKKDLEGYEAYIEKEVANKLRQEITDLRNKIIETCGGVIPKNQATELLEAGLNEFLSINYMDKTTRKIDFSKYSTSMLENEALVTQQASEFEFSTSGCFIKHQKELLEETLKDPKMVEYLETTLPD